MKIKRIVAAGAVATTLAGGAFAFANSLTVSSTTLASGTDTVDKGCESVAVDWESRYVEDDNSYELASIALDGGTGCVAQDYRVTVADVDGGTLKEYTGTLSSGDDTITVPVTDHIDAAAVENVSAVITG